MNGYNFTQGSASATWTINHNLNNPYPNVDCFMTYLGDFVKVIPLTVIATDANTLTVTFSSAYAGYARVTA